MNRLKSNGFVLNTEATMMLRTFRDPTDTK